jgi:hypothetical protein
MPPQQSAAVPFRRHVDDARAQRPGNLLRSVGAAVVRHHDLAIQKMLVQRPPRLADAPLDRFRFIQARHHHRNFETRATFRRV